MPNRISRLLVSLLILPLMVLVVGCPKKPPPEPAQTTAPGVGEKPAPATDVPSESGFQETAETPSSLDEQDEALRKLNAQKVLGTIYFEFNKSDLSSEALEQLRKNAQWLKTNSKYRVRIEGNCDDRGTVEYNLALGERRATAAKSYLVKAGIDGSRIETISYGEEHPVDPGHNEEAWLKNRRDDFVVIR
ncbi:MAG TPA: peptidoglycan-associated lipoprotein Pal [Candidatus Polarisedimenticolia bacterium]|jgi:peptidoglycan-associated lipoprotein|nr:peptidoglycan-associated lipoprotein Pal [Candidatus Polarisedimenticolia bacterium]